jgi:hypothetical protein
MNTHSGPQDGPQPPRIRAAARLTLIAFLMLFAPMAMFGARISSAAAAAGGSSLQPGETLYDGQALSNGQYTMAMQSDGNFVLYDGNRSLWQSGTSGRGGAWVSMQGDGNLVVYNSANRPLWWSGTAGHGGSRLAVQTDGNAVIYNSANQALWATNTYARPSQQLALFDDTAGALVHSIFVQGPNQNGIASTVCVATPTHTTIQSNWWWSARSYVYTYYSSNCTGLQVTPRLWIDIDGHTPYRCLSDVPPYSDWSCASPLHHHFRIELKTWIPQPYVADPFDPALTPGINPSFTCGVHLATASRFLGDNYSSFDGGSSVRGSRIVDFDWDGSRITNFRTQVVLGVTHRVVAYSDLFSSGSCIQAQQASDGGFSTQAGPANVSMAIQTSNPLIPGSPAIHATMNIAVSPDGTLNIDSQTTFFPSIAFRVTRDGQTSATDVVNDASCLSNDSVLGVTGVTTLGIGLLNFNNGPDHVVVPPGAINQTMIHRDWLLCH